MLNQLLTFIAPINRKCRSLEFVLMCAKLEAEPNLKLSKLLNFLEGEVKISLSTANRLVTNASDAGYITLFKSGEGHHPSLVRLAAQTRRRFEKLLRNTD